MVRRSLPIALAAALAAAVPAARAAAADKDVNVVNTPSVNVANVPSVVVSNTPSVTVANVPTVQLSPGGSLAATQAGSWTVSVLPALLPPAGTLTLSGPNGVSQIPISSASFSVTNAATVASGGGAGAGKASFRELVVTRTMDASSPQLFLAVAQGTVFASGSVAVVDASGSTTTFDLQNVVVTSLTSGSNGSALPLETVGLTYGAIRVQLANPSGTVLSTVSWDVLSNARL